MKQITTDVSKCTGCNQCVLTCSFVKTRMFSLHASRVHVIQWEDLCLSVPMLCQQCVDPACISACPSDALGHHTETNAILLDPAACNQCEQCILMCTYQVMHADSDRTPVTCDLCGGDPACVKACYPGALQFEDVPQGAREPLREFAEVLSGRTAGKNVLAPPELLRVARLAT